MSTSLDQIFKSRSAFKDEATTSLTIVLACFGAGGYLLFKTLEQRTFPAVCMLLALFAMAWYGFVIYICRLVSSKLEAGYDLYAETITYAAIICKGLGLSHHGLNKSELQYPHGWIEGHEKLAETAGYFKRLGGRSYKFYKKKPFLSSLLLEKSSSKAHLTAVWKSNPKTLYQLYRRTLAATALAAALLFLASLTTAVLAFQSNHFRSSWQHFFAAEPAALTSSPTTVPQDQQNPYFVGPPRPTP